MDWYKHIPDADKLSHEVPRENPSIDGFCREYPLRRHIYEKKADEGCFKLREDWERYIGPIERWGGCNAFEGNFSSVVLPFCLPERLSLVSYILEYAFFYDNVLESVSKAPLDVGTDSLVLSETDYRTVRSATGTKQIQSKMLLELLSIDRPCAEVVIESWKEMVATTAARDKSCIFNELDEYVEYRIIDTGAPFVDTIMRFGMGLILTKEEEESLAPIAKFCFAALGLANDYFSFDIEWEEHTKCQEEGNDSTMTNLVWLYMQWENLSISDAKEKTKETVRGFEKEYYERMEAFLLAGCSTNSAIYLKALAFEIPGNVAWSLRCPRYHPELWVEANSILRSQFEVQFYENDNSSDSQDTPKFQEKPVIPAMIRTGSETSGSSECCPYGSEDSIPSSGSSIGSEHKIEIDEKILHVDLGDQKLIAPYDYITSLPSKGVRESLIDALNVWLMLPASTIKIIKDIATRLHSSSLMLDDIEDHSDLRRGYPATHKIFGPGSTINSANFQLISVMNDVHKLNLNNPGCMEVVFEELRNLFIGQSYDLHWTRQGECPSEEEYLKMVDQKTGGLFRLIARLMLECAKSLQKKTIPLDLMNPLGRYFQVRDDYKNLVDNVYTDQKGFAEDLDEGKYSFPIVAALNSKPPDLVLQGILRESRTSHNLSIPQKRAALDRLHRQGYMDHTLQALKKLEIDIKKELTRVEDISGSKNWVMRLFIEKLVV